MPTTMLTGSAPAHLPRLPITVIVETENAHGAVDVVVDPAVDVRRPRPGMVVLPAINREITITAKPANGTTFPTPTVLHLTAMVTAPGIEDHDRVVVPGVTASGLPVMDLLLLTPVPGQIALARPTAPESPILSELGTATMIATRAALGRSRVTEGDRVDVGILIDGSASMATAVRSGSVSDAIDIITGIVPVLGRGERAELQVALSTPRAVDADPAHQGLAVTDVLTNAALTTGFIALSRRTWSCELVFVVTDGLPADHDRLDRGLHLVILGDPSSEPALRSMTSAPFTVMPIDPEPEGVPIVDNAEELDRIARSLTVNWMPEPTGRM